MIRPAFGSYCATGWFSAMFVMTDRPDDTTFEFPAARVDCIFCMTFSHAAGVAMFGSAAVALCAGLSCTRGFCATNDLPQRRRARDE